MHVSARSDYALRALIALAAGQVDEPLSAEYLGRAQHIPQPFLQAILADLRRSGMVRSQRGQGGGWVLARDPGTIAVAEILRAVDGPLVSVHGLRPEAVKYSAGSEALQLVWIAARGALRDVLERVTLRDLVSGRLPREVLARAQDADAWQPR